MPTCKNCSNHFPNQVTENGKQLFLNKRAYCLTCSPKGSKKFCGPISRYKDIPVSERYKGKTCSDCNSYMKYRSKNNVCSKCRGKKIRIRNKQRAVEMCGGKCVICGYFKSRLSLIFHHIKEEEKTFNLSTGWEKPWDVLENEIKKCMLVCANCHGELHEQTPKYGVDITTNLN